MSEPVGYELRGSVAVVTLDDGKANALSPALIAALQTTLDRAEKEARALLLVGRPGRFSAGFDLSVMREGGDAVVSLVRAGAELALRLYAFPAPVVIACTGHALAMGAILLLAADARIGAKGDFKIGLNEVAIGMSLPVFGVEFARERLTRRHLDRAVTQAEIYGPKDARKAGFLDRVTDADEVVSKAVAEAERLAALDPVAHATTKRRLRDAAIARIRASLDGTVSPFAGRGDAGTGASA
ncbi:MAG: crotonase/enoyl-CoA hydratase family protein [Deltaproteobacteria bacterium]|nr:MAG: crotonase/enoyl-CoA hydratase family protein [Deltaproteobacteria bacterium]